MPLEKTKLARGDTKPATVKYIGTPLTMVAPMVSAYGMILGLMPNWHWRIAGLVVLVIVGMGLAALVRRDYNALRIAMRWVQGKGRSLTNRQWNGATIEPFPRRRSKTPRGIS